MAEDKKESKPKIMTDPQAYIIVDEDHPAPNPKTYFKYQSDLPDELPPIETALFIDNYGQKSLNPDLARNLDPAMFWRRHEKSLSLIMLTGSFGLLVMLLTLTTSYQDALWKLIVDSINGVIAWAIGEILKVIPFDFSQIPKLW